MKEDCKVIIEPFTGVKSKVKKENTSPVMVYPILSLVTGVAFGCHNFLIQFVAPKIGGLALVSGYWITFIPIWVIY